MPPEPPPPHSHHLSHPPVWAIVGPTACGKSALALTLAKSIGAEIISADAVQVYRGCTIGSAKPTPQQRALVPHHLLDVAEPGQSFDASQFVRAATAAMADIRTRGRVPLLCGGTGLYLRALRLGLIEVPKAPALRAELEAADAEEPGASMRRLQALDPESARTIDPCNGAYVRRALEITLLTGRPASALRQEHSRAAELTPMVLWWVDRSDAALRVRIKRRAHAMLEQGFVAEVQRLLAAGVSPDSTAMRSLGYRDVVAMEQGRLAPEDLTAAIVRNTWQYVRRQRIWLRREERQAPHLVRRLLLADASVDADAEGDEVVLRAAEQLTALHATAQPQRAAAAPSPATTGSINR